MSAVPNEAELAEYGGRALERLRTRSRRAKPNWRASTSLDFCATGHGSLVGLHFGRGPIRRESDVPEAEELRGLLHLHMLERGWSYGRRGFVALSLPIGEGEIDGFAAAVEAFLSDL